MNVKEAEDILALGSQCEGHLGRVVVGQDEHGWLAWLEDDGGAAAFAEDADGSKRRRVMLTHDSPRWQRSATEEGAVRNVVERVINSKLAWGTDGVEEAAAKILQEAKDRAASLRAEAARELAAGVAMRGAYEARGSVVFLHRPKMLDEGEMEAAARHFRMATSRMDVRPGDTVVARHFAWPWPRELFDDLRRVGARAINGLRGHAYAADILAWSADLSGMCPETTDRFELLPEEGPYIVKAEKADKGRWWRTFAETKADAIRLRSELMEDSGMRDSTVVARRYVKLMSLGPPAIPGACPPSAEYRVWVAMGRVVSAGWYWPTEDCDASRLAAAPDPSSIPAEFIQQAIDRVSPHIEFFTLDVGYGEDGSWWVIEVSDGLRAGMSGNDPDKVYAGLANAIACRGSR